MALLRAQDDQYRTHAQFVDDQVERDGLRVAANLSSLLMKRKNQEKLQTQRKVSVLADLVKNVNTLVNVRHSKQPGNRKDAEDDEDDDDEDLLERP